MKYIINIFLVALLVLIGKNSLAQNTGIAYIENPQVNGLVFSWELHFERTNNWTPGLLENALGSSAASFNFNTLGLTNPSLVVEPGGPLDNANYNVTVQIINDKCIVDIQWALNELAGTLPLNVKTNLLTVSMDITNTGLTAGLSWDAVNTGFFDNADATVVTTLVGSSNIPLVGSPTILVLPTSLSDFTYIVGGGPSTSQSYNLSGSSLTPASGNLTVTESTNYEVSLDDTNFSGIVSVAYSGGILATTPIYVRLKAGLPSGSYDGEIIANEGGGATTQNVTCNGAVGSVPVPLPVWTNQILLEDAGGTEESSQELTFGQHVDATDSIDATLGEYELLPPIPGIFDSRFNLPTNPEMGSLIDYRDSALTEITWKLTFQPGSAGYPMTFSWDSTSFPEGTFYLKDLINRSYAFVNMKNQSSFVLTEPAITSLNISYKGNCSMVSVNNYWNMISVPVLAEDMALSNLFPTANSLAYGYEGGYVPEDTLTVGEGYWLKFGGNEDIQICGSLPGDTIQIKEGWNMFGAYEEDILVSQLTTIPPGIIVTNIFGYEDGTGYYIADTLKSGKGYWVRVTSDGIINLNGGALEKDGKEKQFARVENNWGKIKITDNKGKSVTLYATEEETDLSLYELPPAPPNGVFDARYGSGRFLESLGSEKIILISSDNYPITIRAKGLNITVRDRISGKLLNEKLNSGEELTIINNKITSIEVTEAVTGAVTEELPISYELYQNYPNPFNPSTTIRFSLPEQTQLKLNLYNMLGELVETIAKGNYEVGNYKVTFNAGNLPSGVYVYRIESSDFVQVKKMMLLR